MSAGPALPAETASKRCIDRPFPSDNQTCWSSYRSCFHPTVRVSGHPYTRLLCGHFSSLGGFVTDKWSRCVMNILSLRSRPLHHPSFPLMTRHALMAFPARPYQLLAPHPRPPVTSAVVTASCSRGSARQPPASPWTD